MTMSRSDLPAKATTSGSLLPPPSSILELPPKASLSTLDTGGNSSSVGCPLFRLPFLVPNFFFGQGFRFDDHVRCQSILLSLPQLNDHRQGVGGGTAVTALVAVNKEGEAGKHAKGDEDDGDGDVDGDLLGGDDGRGGLGLGGGGRDGVGRGDEGGE